MASTKRSKSDLPPPITVEDHSGSRDPHPLPPENHEGAQSTSSNPDPPSRPQLHPRRTSTWNKRNHSPALDWHSKWTADSWPAGRVLIIDYIPRSHTSTGRLKIAAQEISSIDGLSKFYAHDHKQAALRVMHVQNARWATRFLLKKFNIDASNHLVGTTFGKWAKYDRPAMRGGKAVLGGKTFRVQRDPWRGIVRSGFGMDFLRGYGCGEVVGDDERMKIMELNGYDEGGFPAHCFDVFAQRVSVYVQRSVGDSEELPEDLDVGNPYDEGGFEEYQRDLVETGRKKAKGKRKYIPKLEALDNGNTIIIFEHSQSGSVEDTLIAARQEIESRWRRLSFYLPRESTSNDTRLATACMDFILRDIFKALAFSWEKYIALCETHVGILEDTIYDSPADESRAPELWTNSRLWLKVERLLITHIDVLNEMTIHLTDMLDPSIQNNNNNNNNNPTPTDLEKLLTQFQSSVTKPTSSLNDLMYKSVGIRDARHSIQLGHSMWRLSWITFIFLPLTFMCSFFGMNVDAFAGNPSIGYWFATAVPVMVGVLASWYGVKHLLKRARHDPVRRSVYEVLFRELEVRYPGLWSRAGPREGVVVVGWWNAVKWRLLHAWFKPESTVLVPVYDGVDEELGTWARFKRFLVMRWLESMQVLPDHHPLHRLASKQLSLPLSAMPETVGQELGAVTELLSHGTPVAGADEDPDDAARTLRSRFPVQRLGSLSPSGSEARPYSSGEAGSGVMVEEEKTVSEEERSGDDGVGACWSRS